MSTLVKLPGLGESIDSIELIKVLVAVGDQVKAEQNILELETGKAIMELPTPFTGIVTEIMVKAGDHIEVGHELMRIDEADQPQTPNNVEIATAATEEIDEPSEAQVPVSETITPVVAKVQPEHHPSGKNVPAAPSVRKFAREIGIVITDVPGSGPHGRVSIEDVKAYAKHLNQHNIQGSSHPDSLPPLPNFETWGVVQREKMSTVRYQTARQVTRCWSQIPMVTQFGEANITNLEVLRKKYAARAKESGGNLTIAVMMIKIIASALKIYPQFNASVDMERKELIFKKYFNIGIAVSTPRGLFVPVLKEIDQKNMVQIACEVSKIARKARSGKLTPQDMEGGCFTLTNLGAIAGTHFTPIVNSPEVAILGMGRSFTNAGYIDGEWIPQTMLPLSLSYDHRMIDGADGAKFIKWIIEAIEEPLILSLEG